MNRQDPTEIKKGVVVLSSSLVASFPSLSEVNFFPFRSKNQMRKRRDLEIRQTVRFGSVDTIRFLAAADGPSSADSNFAQLKEVDVTSCSWPTAEVQAVGTTAASLPFDQVTFPKGV